MRIPSLLATGLMLLAGAGAAAAQGIAIFKDADLALGAKLMQ